MSQYAIEVHMPPETELPYKLRERVDSGLRQCADGRIVRFLDLVKMRPAAEQAAKDFSKKYPGQVVEICLTYLALGEKSRVVLSRYLDGQQTLDLTKKEALRQAQQP